MEAGNAPGAAVDAPYQEQKLSSVLRSLLVALSLALYAVWLYLCYDAHNWVLWRASIALTSVVGWLWFLSAKRPRLAAVSMVTGMASGMVAITCADPQGLASRILAVPIFCGALLFGPTAGLFVAGSMALAFFCLGRTQPDLVLAAASAGVTGVLLWVGLRTWQSMLAIYCEQAAKTTGLVKSLRDNQGKLNATIKALDTAYRLLESSNRELILARQEAEELRQLKTRFATQLSHELRTPLNIILGFSQLIYRNPRFYGYPQWGQELLRDLAQIQRNVTHLSELVDDIVDLARVDALAMPVRRESADLGRVIEEAMSTVRSLAASRGVELLHSCPGDMVSLPMDTVRIRQVLFNLLTNAIRYTERGSVAVRVALSEEEAIVAVSDTGCGIAEADLATVFNEFYQIGRPRDSVGAGKGLGLAIAKRFVQLHGGRIWAESQVGKGSTFSFSLPLTFRPSSLVRQQAAPLPPRARGKPVVLVLSDDGIAPAFLARHLEAYEFLWAKSAATADELRESAKPLAVIVNAPATGQADPLLGEVTRSIGDGVPILQCALPSTQWLTGTGAFAAVLTKPVSAEDLLKTVSETVGETVSASVLVVDDDRGFAQLVRRLLEAHLGQAVSVSTSYSGGDALARMRSDRFDIVLLDLAMPEMSGFEVVAEMNEDPALKHIPVVAVTALTPGEEQLATEVSSFRLVRKGPHRPGELLRLIGTALEAATSVSFGLMPDTAAATPEAVPERRASADTR